MYETQGYAQAPSAIHVSDIAISLSISDTCLYCPHSIHCLGSVKYVPKCPVIGQKAWLLAWHTDCYVTGVSNIEQITELANQRILTELVVVGESGKSISLAAVRLMQDSSEAEIDSMINLAYDSMEFE
jgi:hypothetical protein